VVTGPTPGQAAYEAHRASWWKRHGMPTEGLLPDGQWEQMSGVQGGGQEDWEAVAQAVLKAGTCPHGDLAQQLAAAEAERDKAYSERARLVAYLAACYPSEIVPAESDSGAWFLVFVTTPAGQMSWHLHEDDLDLFEPLLNAPETGIEWDGHTTEQKYERLAELTRTTWNGTAPVEQLRDQLAGLRERFENLAAGLVLSASSSAPSKKSEIEDGCARAIRGILEG
jgi:hypothetical protein